MARRASPAASIAGLIGAALLAGCAGEPPAAARGRSLVQAHGCGACHVIPGVPGARGRAGPSLEAVGRRAYLGGVVPNSREQDRAHG
jgi:cytochrome c